MNGQLGTLWVGKIQVGGLQNWTLDLSLNESVKDTTTVYKLARWKLTAQSYWLYDVPDKIVVRLYPDKGKGWWEGKGAVTSQTRKIFDTLIHGEIEIYGEGILEGKE